jgi:hypothetical protein
MKKALLLLTLFAASVFSAGCETAPTNTAASKEDADVITGSRIPRRGGSDGAVGTMGGDAYKQGQIERSGGTGMKGN